MTIWQWFDNWLIGLQCGKVDYNTYQNANNISYGKEKRKVITNQNNNAITTTSYGLIPSDRRKPPRAEFFGREQDHDLNEAGKLEERFLNTWEKAYWQKQKAREEAKKTGELDETASPIPEQAIPRANNYNID